MPKDYWLFRRRGSTRWVFAWAPDPTKKQKRKQVLLPIEIKHEREAARYAELHEEDLKSAKPRPRTRGATIADLVDRWVDLRKDDERFAAATFRDAQSHLKTWVCKPVGGVDLSSVQPEAVDEPLLRRWIRALIKSRGRGGRPLAAYTIRNILRSLRWLLSDVIGEGWATIPGGNPAKADSVQAELPEMAPIAGKSQRLRIATPELAQPLLDCPAVALQWRVRYALDFTSGMRDGEVAGLRVRDIDRKAGLYHVRKALQLKHRDGYAKLGKTKTRSSERTGPLHAAASDALEEWLGDGWEVHVGRPPTPDDFIFVKRDGTPWRPRSAERFRAHAKLAGLPHEVDGHKLTFHALRRSFVTWLRAEKVPQEVRQVLMGHVPRTAEEKHYSEEDPSTLTEHVAKIRLVWRRVQSIYNDAAAEQMSVDKLMSDRSAEHTNITDSEV